MCVIIRNAEERDIVCMAELDNLCFTVPWSLQSFEQEIKDNDKAFYLIAESEGAVIGYAGLWRILNEGHITNVAVHPDFRQSGIGEKLVSELIEESKMHGTERFTLEVRISNDAAISLYTKLHFEPAGIRKKYYEDNGEDALIMWR